MKDYLLNPCIDKKKEKKKNLDIFAYPSIFTKMVQNDCNALRFGSRWNQYSNSSLNISTRNFSYSDRKLVEMDNYDR